MLIYITETHFELNGATSGNLIDKLNSSQKCIMLQRGGLISAAWHGDGFLRLKGNPDIVSLPGFL